MYDICQLHRHPPVFPMGPISGQKRFPRVVSTRNDVDVVPLLAPAGRLADPAPRFSWSFLDEEGPKKGPGWRMDDLTASLPHSLIGASRQRQGSPPSFQFDLRRRPSACILTRAFARANSHRLLSGSCLIIIRHPHPPSAMRRAGKGESEGTRGTLFSGSDPACSRCSSGSARPLGLPLLTLPQYIVPRTSCSRPGWPQYLHVPYVCGPR